jgi:hypothetical protein
VLVRVVSQFDALLQQLTPIRLLLKRYGQYAKPCSNYGVKPWISR